MSYIRTTVYLDQEDLTNLEISLLKNGKDRSISSLFRRWIKLYLEKNGYSSETVGLVETVISPK